ncbi:MAG: single-stranded-DNA-specific exonuclease RecJ [Caldilineaceae bacterium]|nr:single-stranded-DNA-specific exonuclease RecJ [Caldilineaceae bacterium]
MGQQAKNWVIQPSAPAALVASVPEHPLLVQVLYNRGLTSAAEIQAFLRGVDAVQENPYKLRDMTPAVARIIEAIDRSETICVYGDFDADGVTATTLLVTALQVAGARVGPYIPDRVDEGYGLNLDAIERIAQQAQLLITVDCGMRSLREVALARQWGLDVIITDHHSVGAELPAALAVINPRRKDCQSNAARLAGVGVAYRLAQALLRAVAQRRGSRIDESQVSEIEESLLDLVALGTVADMMPLLGENRTLVQRGLARLNKPQRIGVETLLTVADLRPGTVDATAISFRLAPRLNAAGRLAHAKLAYQLLRTQDPTQAYSLAMELESLNNRRRTLTEQAQTIAEAQLHAQMDHDQALYVVHSPKFVAGIVGLVAGKLMDRFYRPVLVIEEGAEESRGSARSIPEFDISAALDEVGGLLIRHGGHSRAAGFTVATPQLPAFADALQAVAQRELSMQANLRPTLAVDAVITLDEVNWNIQEQFMRLEPMGQENPPPLLLSRNVRVREARPIGSQKQHMRLIVDAGPNTPVYDAVAFQQGVWAKALPEGTHLDLVFQVEANEWQGRKRLQLNVQDLRISA